MAKKQSSTLPVAFDEELARMASALRGAEAASATGNFISVRGGIMQWRQQPIEGNKMDAIILASVFENDYYTDAFDPESPTSPDCYAFATTLDALKPHADAPNKQGDKNGLCAACWANGFGSDARGGRGKACQNRRRLAVIPSSALEDSDAVAAAELAFMRVPVMSVAGYSNHAIQIADAFKLPVFGVVTEISVVPDAKSQFRMLFKVKNRIADKHLLAALLTRATAAAGAIAFAYAPTVKETAPKRRQPVNASRVTRPGKPAAKDAPAKNAARKF